MKRGRLAAWLVAVALGSALVAGAFVACSTWLERVALRDMQNRGYADRAERAGRAIEEVAAMDGYTDLLQLRAGRRNDTNFLLAATGAHAMVYAFVVNRQGEIVLHTDRSREGARIDAKAAPANVAMLTVTRIEANIAGARREVCDVDVPLRLGGNVQGVLRIGFMVPDADAGIDCGYRGVRLAGVAAVAASGIVGLAGMWLLARTMTRRFERIVLAERHRGEQKIGVIGAGIAHEVKNALNGIRMNAHLLLQQLDRVPGEERQSLQKKIERIEAESTRTGTMLNEFLSFAKPSDFTPAPVNVVALLDDIAQFFEHECRQRTIKVTCACQSALTAVMADELLLRHGITNLMWNAVQAIDANGTIEVSGARDRGRVAIHVRDSGGGIAPEHADKVFEVFYSTKPRGAGLGLSIVQRVARVHGGDVTLENRPGAGCTFTISFPLVAA